MIPFRKSGMDLTSGCKLVRRWNDFLNGDDSWPPSASGVGEESDDDRVLFFVLFFLRVQEIYREIEM